MNIYHFLLYYWIFILAILVSNYYLYFLYDYVSKFIQVYFLIYTMTSFPYIYNQKYLIIKEKRY